MIQYIKQINNNGTIQNIGCLVAEVENGKVKIGFSILHPNDQKEIEQYNLFVKRANAESWKMRNFSANNAPIEGYKPKFDKKKAVELARCKMTDAVDLKSVPKRLHPYIFPFISSAIRHLKGSVVLK